jgi:hypothetical protein
MARPDDLAGSTSPARSSGRAIDRRPSVSGPRTWGIVGFEGCAESSVLVRPGDLHPARRTSQARLVGQERRVERVGGTPTHRPVQPVELECGIEPTEQPGRDGDVSRHRVRRGRSRCPVEGSHLGVRLDQLDVIFTPRIGDVPTDGPDIQPRSLSPGPAPIIVRDRCRMSRGDVRRPGSSGMPDPGRSCHGTG